MMSPRFDVLVVDLDGTLLNRDGTISQRNRESLHRVRDAGMEVIVATGRALAEARHALNAIDHQGLLIAAGGSLLCDCATGRTIDRDALAPEIVSHVATELLEHELRVLVLKDAHVTGYDYLLVGEAALDPASTWWFSTLPVELRHTKHIDLDAHPEHSLRAGAVASEEKLLPIAKALRESLAGRAFLQHWSAVTETHATGSPTHLLEVFDHAVDKWTMVERYCRTHDLDPQRVAAIGDGLNDVQLIRNAGLGIAMANSDPRVLAVADHRTAHHEDDGVAVAIDQFVLQSSGIIH